jgi:hypothetical protein
MRSASPKVAVDHQRTTLRISTDPTSLRSGGPARSPGSTWPPRRARRSPCLANGDGKNRTRAVTRNRTIRVTAQ